MRNDAVALTSRYNVTTCCVNYPIHQNASVNLSFAENNSIRCMMAKDKTYQHSACSGTINVKNLSEKRGFKLRIECIKHYNIDTNERITLRICTINGYTCWLRAWTQPLRQSTRKNILFPLFIRISIISVCHLFFSIIIIIIPFAIFFRSICHLITNECTEETNKKTKAMNFEPSSSDVLCAHEKILFLNNNSVAFIYSPISRCAFTHTRTQSTRNDNNALLLNRKNKAEHESKGRKKYDTKTVVSKMVGEAIGKNANESEKNSLELRRKRKENEWSNAFAGTKRTRNGSSSNNNNKNNFAKLFQYNHNNHLSRKWMKDEEHVSLFIFSLLSDAGRWHKTFAKRSIAKKPHGKWGSN